MFIAAIHTYQLVSRDSNQAEQTLSLFSSLYSSAAVLAACNKRPFCIILFADCSLVMYTNKTSEHCRETMSCNVRIVPSEKMDMQLLSQVIQTIP